MADASACRIGHDSQRTGWHPASRVRFAGLRPPLTPAASSNTTESTHSKLKRGYLLDAAGLKADEGQGGAVTLIQRFGSAANLNIHLHCLVLDGVYRRAADGSPAFIEAASPTDDELHALLQSVIERLMKLLTRRGVLVEDMG